MTKKIMHLYHIATFDIKPPFTKYAVKVEYDEYAEDDKTVIILSGCPEIFKKNTNATGLKICEPFKTTGCTGFAVIMENEDDDIAGICLSMSLDEEKDRIIAMMHQATEYAKLSTMLLLNKEECVDQTI